MNMPISTDQLQLGDPAARGRFSDWRMALKTIIGFWAIYVVTVVARAFLGSDPTTILLNKVLTLAVGLILTGLLYLAIALLAPGPSIRRKAVVAGFGSAIACVVLASTLVLSEGRQ